MSHPLELWVWVVVNHRGCWQLNVDSLEEQPVSLTTEPCIHAAPPNTHMIFNVPNGNIYLRTGENSFNGRFCLTHYLQALSF